MNKFNYDEITREARRMALSMIYSAGSGHPGGSLSCIEIISLLAHEYLDWQSGFVEGSDQNTLVLSKGHACPGLYAVAAVAGLLEESELPSFRKLNSRLQGHPHLSCLPWVGSSTGSLGQGFSVALGQALGARIKGTDQKIFTVLGDGELQEGMVWEAAGVASHHELGNLIAFIDYNKMQSDDLNENICGIEPLGDRWKSFGWHLQEVDGHNIDDLRASVQAALDETDCPSVIVAHTVKGKGVSYMEGVPKWHGSVCLSEEELSAALGDLGYDQAAQHKFFPAYQEARVKS